MGYYDGPNLNEEHSETREVRKSGSKKAIFHRFSRSCSWGCFISFAAPYMPWAQNNGATVSSLVQIQKLKVL